ncbi:DUF1064 domain-containing protein [Kurthia gibsonii]|uniref:DUF1064 domain-containing protein n=1 Tax=Kurthia gibsonii TaxID=33946 RepID=UPI00301B0605
MSKYNNKKVVYAGITFDSKAERDYYLYLLDLKQRGIVTDIQLQPSFLLQEKFRKNDKLYREITYKADFKVTYADSHVEIIDVKGMVTKDFAIKQKLFEYKYPALRLLLVAYSKIDGGWINLDELKKARSSRKRNK